MSEHRMQPMTEPCHKQFFDGAINLGRCHKDRGHNGACAPDSNFEINGVSQAPPLPRRHNRAFERIVSAPAADGC